MELFGILLAFSVLILLINRKVTLALAMLAAAGVVLLFTNPNPLFMLRVMWEATLDRDTLDLVIIVVSITCMAHVLQHFSFFDRMVHHMRTIFRNDRITTLLIPGLIGCMPMTGGAIVSAPMVRGVADEFRLPPAQQSAANLIFRHSWYFLFPFMPTFILTSRLANIEVYDLIARMWPLTFVMLISGYFFLLRPRTGSLTHADAAETMAPVSLAEWIRHLGQFAFYAAPLLVGVLLFIGFRLHLAISLGVGLMIAFIQASTLNQKQSVSLPIALRLLWNGIDIKLAGAMVAIMIFRGAVNETTAFQDLLSTMLGIGIPLSVITIGLAILIGYVSASHSSTIAVLVPLIIPVVHQAGGDVIGSIASIYSFAFLAYLISPLHLCQILTNHYFKVSLADVYRAYLPVILVVTIAAALLLL